MKCIICKNGETIQGFTTMTLEKKGTTIVFKQVPAKICDNCGEKYIDSQVTSEVLDKANTLTNNGVEIDIRTYQQNAA